MIPGHAIEAGWMLLTEAKLQNMSDLQKTAIDHFIMAPLSAGWDSKHGGIFYFLDVDGHDPIQLEWSMKLWWVHCETLISLLMAYQTTGDNTIWERFCKVLDYTLKHFPDPQYGEWYGYLTREGNINQKFKGGPFKGKFSQKLSILDYDNTINRMLPCSSLPSHVLSYVGTFTKTKYS